MLECDAEEEQREAGEEARLAGAGPAQPPATAARLAVDDAYSFVDGVPFIWLDADTH